MSSAEIYTKEIHDQLQRYATWLPSERVTVGDVGVLRDNIFTREAHLTDFGINATAVKDPATNATYKFMSAKTSETQGSVGAAGALPQGASAKADLTIGFGKKDSVYFFLTKCVGSAIENQLKLGTEILKRVKTKEWKLDYVVVTRVVNAGSATILQAASKNASIVFEGTAKSPALELLSAGASLNVRSGSFSGFSAITKGQLTPLFTLGKVDYGILDWVLERDPEFTASTNVKTARIGVSRLRRIVESSPDINFASSPGTSPDHEELTVMLPKYGEHVDINNLVEFAVNAHEGFSIARKAVRGRIGGGYKEEPIKPLSSLGLCNMRIQGKRIRSLANKKANIEWETKAGDKDYVQLSVMLPKSGTSVDFAPLLDFAGDAIQAKATATMTAELSFHEID